jgi:hypothetical protein
MVHLDALRHRTGDDPAGDLIHRIATVMELQIGESWLKDSTITDDADPGGPPGLCTFRWAQRRLTHFLLDAEPVGLLAAEVFDQPRRG